MDIDLLNSSFANNLSDLNMDISDSTIVASNTTSTTTDSATTTASGESTAVTNNSNENSNTKNTSTDILLKESDLSALGSITSTGTNTTTNGEEDKKDILDFLNTEDLENNLKLFPFTDQSLLLPSNHKDITLGADGNVQGLSGGLPILNDSTLTDPSALSVISNSSTNQNTESTTTSAKTSTTLTTSAPASTTDVTVTLNHPAALTMNATATTATDATAVKVDSTIPPPVPHSNPGDILGPQNALIALPPNMMNGPSTYYNMAAAGHPAAGLPHNPAMAGGPKVAYYPQPVPAGAAPPTMVKAPAGVAGPQNEIIMKKAYNGN